MQYFAFDDDGKTLVYEYGIFDAIAREYGFDLYVIFIAQTYEEAKEKGGRLLEEKRAMVHA